MCLRVLRRMRVEPERIGPAHVPGVAHDRTIHRRTRGLLQRWPPLPLTELLRPERGMNMKLGNIMKLVRMKTESLTVSELLFSHLI